MKVPCTECNRVCRRKVVTRGSENLNRIYYKCEDCNHKVGWEDELLAGTAPRTKGPALPAPPAPPAAIQPPARSDADDEVEILFERPAIEPVKAKGRGNAGAAAAGPPPPPAPAARPGAPQALSPDSCEEAEQAPQAAARHGAQAPPPQRPQTAAPVREQQAASKKPAALPNRPATAPPRSQAGNGSSAAAEAALNAAAPFKRKFEDFCVDGPGRPAKRPAHEVPAAAPAAAAAGAHARAVPIAGATRVNGASAVDGVQVVAGPGLMPAVGGGMYLPRNVKSLGTDRPATGLPAAAAAARQAPAAGLVGARGVVSPVVGEGGGSYSPSRVKANTANVINLDTEEVLRQEIRRLRKDLTTTAAHLKEEQARAQQEAAATQAARLRLEPLERELKELRLKAQTSSLRERQLLERLNAYVARDRLAAAAQVAAQQAAAQQAAAQQAAAQQAAAQQAAAQQAAAQEQEARRSYYWAHSGHYAQPQHTFFGGTVPQAGGMPQGAAGGPGGSPGRGGAGPGQANGGTGSSAHRGAEQTYRANGSGTGATSADPMAPKEPAAPRDDPVVLSFAMAPVPVLDENTPVRALKIFLSEAGAGIMARMCSEKTELLGLARERLNGWEIRRAVACNKLVNQAQGDRALFRIEAGAGQRPALVKAYRDLMLRLHPDKNPGDELATPAFQYLQEAYKRLGSTVGG